MQGPLVCDLPLIDWQTFCAEWLRLVESGEPVIIDPVELRFVFVERDEGDETAEADESFTRGG